MYNDKIKPNLLHPAAQNISLLYLFKNIQQVQAVALASLLHHHPTRLLRLNTSPG